MDPGNTFSTSTLTRSSYCGLLPPLLRLWRWQRPEGSAGSGFIFQAATSSHVPRSFELRDRIRERSAQKLAAIIALGTCSSLYPLSPCTVTMRHLGLCRAAALGMASWSRRSESCMAKIGRTAGRVRSETQAICASCGSQTTAPFKPTKGTPVLCVPAFRWIDTISFLPITRRTHNEYAPKNL